MKKVLCLVLVVLMLSMMSSWTYAQANESDKSAKMESVLQIVKQKISVPDELTEFKPSTRERVNSGKVEYVFRWYNEDGGASFEVSCDGEGRINRYYFYDNSLNSRKKLTVLSKANIIEFAETFLRKTLPEAFENDNDILIFDEESWSVNGLNYSLRYIRMRDGVEVKDNEASLNICVYNDVPYVRNMSVYLNYEAEFDSVPKDAEGYKEKYKVAFPLELIYKDDVQYYWKMGNVDNKKVETVLVYRHKDNNFGYTLAETGEIAEEDNLYELYGDTGGGATNEKFETSADAAMGEESFTKQELAELERIKGLISKDDLKKIVKNIPNIGYNDTLEMSSHGIYFYDEKYAVETEFRNNDTYQYVNICVDGETGEVISLRSYVPSNKVSENKELTEAEKRNADEKIDKFLNVVAKEKFGEYALQNEDIYSKRVNKTYDRTVNDIRYISDRISVSFDAENGYVTNYNIDYASKREFAEPIGIVDMDTAYNVIIESAKLKKIYVHTGGTYKVCYTIGEYGTEIDAFTGEKFDSVYGAEPQKIYEYSDIGGHWAEKIIQKLGESQIGFKGEKFLPDEPANQLDLLKIFAAATRDSYYLNYDMEDIYEMFIDEGILTKEEKNPSGFVKREDAFVYMVRLEGLEDVAKLHDIFKVEYADENLISKEKIGYPAILTGKKIICGNGGYIRPDELITRAEAAVMVYNYMMSF